MSLHCACLTSLHLQEVVRAARLAVAYWLQFRKDVIVDMTCFRRW